VFRRITTTPEKSHPCVAALEIGPCAWYSFAEAVGGIYNRDNSMQLLTVLLLLVSVPSEVPLAGQWRLESYSRERLAGERQGRRITVTEALGATQALTITVTTNVVTVTMTVTDPRMRGVGVTDRYEVDGQYHEYEWGDTVPRTVGSRIALWTAEGLVVTERPRRDSLSRDVRLALSEDGRRLTKTIDYPPSADPLWTRPIVRDVLVFVRES
jgi:hypothetical protein